ncbi:Myosin-like protein [Globisporangium polare]
MKLFSFGKKQTEEEKAAAQALKAQQKEEKARLAALNKAHKAHEAQARKVAKEEKKRVAREEKEWKKQEKQLRDYEKLEAKRIEKREKQERKRVKKLEKQHATSRRREERRRRKELMRNRRKMKKLRRLQKKQRRAQDPAAHQRQIDVLFAAMTASEQSPLSSSQDPIAVVTTAATPPEFKKRANCFTCRSKFRVNRLRYHCRNCGESCCRKCLSEVKRPIPWQEGKSKPQKVCLLCDTLVFSDRTAASLATASLQLSRSNSSPEVESPPASASSSGSQRPASGSGISVSLSSSRSSRRRLRRNDSSGTNNGSAAAPALTKKPSLWTLPIRPLLKRKRSVEQLRNRQADFELQLEKAAQLSRAHQKTLAIELQPQHSTLAAPLARVS